MLLARAVMLPAAGAVVTLAQLGLPNAQFWERQMPLQWASVVVLAIFALYETVRSVNYAVQAARLREYDNNLRACLSVVISMVVQITGAPWDEIAVRYYRTRGAFIWRRLELVAAVCAGANMVDSHRVFSPGVGLVGTAFSEQVILSEEWGEFVRAATEQGPDAWMKRDKSGRYGLSWGQLRRSDQPDGVIASPTFALSGRPDGCILLSGPLKLADLTGDEMRRTLDELAAALDQLGSPPMGWWNTHDR